MQVVENDDERPAVGGGRQEARERIQAPEAGVIGIELGVVGGRRVCPGELWQEAREPGRAVAEQVAQRARLLLARERAHDLDPGPVRRGAAALPARAPGPRGTAPGGALDECPRERRLADPGLAGEDDEPAAPGQGVVERSIELRQLVLATNQPRTALVGHPLPTRPCSTTITALRV